MAHPGRKPMKKDLAAIVAQYVDDHTDPVPPLLIKLLEETEEQTGLARWSIGKSEGKFLQFLIKIAGVKQAIEIGTFTGYSALLIAAALPDDGIVTTCEINKEFARIALKYFRQSPHGRKIRLEIGPAIETLRRIPNQSADFIFIDADKPAYGRYYDESIRLLKSGGFVMVDNVFWRLKIFKKNITNQNARAIAAFNEKVRRDVRVEKLMLNIRDGVYLIVKK
jgi:caffeoyl-CoA O-methyltransferase